ncbi:hypothetical protein FGO68_gene1032 [Halteria grandinella]|uniref:Uncharacterized protein n=1 Tax=Halteria grandinella TaxID=5974 RepID=A0A8J8T774_HALGN|nr:hypothetical protein FGO68_gene1032 [Halteria grandinella]
MGSTMNAIPEIDLRGSQNGREGLLDESGGKTMPALQSMGSHLGGIRPNKKSKFKTVETQAKEALLQIAAQQQALMTNPQSLMEESIQRRLMTGNTSPAKGFNQTFNDSPTHGGTSDTYNQDVLSFGSCDSPSKRKSRQRKSVIKKPDPALVGKGYPETYDDWRTQKHVNLVQKQRGIIPERGADKIRMATIRNVQTRLRQDALSKKPEPEDENPRIIPLEESLQNKLSQLKQININEEPFTYSLKKVHDRSFIKKLMPCIMSQQSKFSPIGASNSKSPNLLRNTFSVEMYSEFQRSKAAQIRQEANKPIIEVAEEDGSGSPGVTVPRINLENLGVVGPIMGSSKSNHKLEQRLLQEEHQLVLPAQTDTAAINHQKTKNLFQAIDDKDSDNSLFDMITIEIHKLFTQEMSKYKGVTAEYNAMLKRKNLLEAKLFKRRYEKVQKHLNGLSSSDKAMNPFNRPPLSSVFNEAALNSNDQIPQNRELFEFVIKEAFSDMFISVDELKNPDRQMNQQLFKVIRNRYIAKVRANGPSQVELESKQDKFLDIMMSMCENGEFEKLKKKIVDQIGKFAKKVGHMQENQGATGSSLIFDQSMQMSSRWNQNTLRSTSNGRNAQQVDTLMISVDDQAANLEETTQQEVTFMTQQTTTIPTQQDAPGALIESGEGSLSLRIQRQEQQAEVLPKSAVESVKNKTAPRITDYLNFLSQSCNVDFASVPMTSESMRVSPLDRQRIEQGARRQILSGQEARHRL